MYSNNTTPIVNVGIKSDKKIEFVLNKTDILKNNGASFIGGQVVDFNNGSILFNGESFRELVFEPQEEAASFDLKDVTIGINFHWQQKENQRFEGSLKFIIEDNRLTAVNTIDVEKYLTSVISSEMRATSSFELLKAHAVISRSWLMDKIKKHKNKQHDSTSIERNNELIKWYDHDDHKNFDVCADDHCQRYQGITKQTTDAVVKAIDATRGEILTFDGKICDARFSKACGGVSETYENCWDDTPHPYLDKVIDNETETYLPAADLTNEENAKNWIYNGDKDSFCNTVSRRILSQVLNNYDQSTNDFYRWQVQYSQEEIQNIIKTKSGFDFGDIIDLQPVERGVSGRLVRLRIVGSKKSLTVGKELEIRRWLSTSHLYSSAFVVERVFNDNGNETPSRFILKGAGWGHGVGLCQIGAAVMADKGYDYKQILFHYYKGTTLSCNYGP